MNNQYRVVLKGLQPEMDFAIAKQTLASLFKAPPEHIERILSSGSFTVKRGLHLTAAAKYQQAIEAAGGLCITEVDAPPVNDLDFSLAPQVPPMPPTLPVDMSAAHPAVDMVDQNWHYELNGARLGPVSEADMLLMISAGTLGRGSFAWKKGMHDWAPLEATSFASQFAHTPPPLTGEAVNNTLVWFLAFAPAIGLLAVGFLSGLTGYREEKFQWITLALNVALSLLDARQLRKAGHDTSKMWVAWLVPVYLFKRAKALKQNNAYFIVWVVLFCLFLYEEL